MFSGLQRESNRKDYLIGLLSIRSHWNTYLEQPEASACNAIKSHWMVAFMLETNCLWHDINWMLRRIMSEAGSSSWQKLRLFVEEVSIWEGLVSISLQGFLGCLFENFFIYFLTCLFQGGIGHEDVSITLTVVMKLIRIDSNKRRIWEKKKLITAALE